MHRPNLALAGLAFAVMVRNTGPSQRHVQDAPSRRARPRRHHPRPHRRHHPCRHQGRDRSQRRNERLEPTNAVPANRASRASAVLEIAADRGQRDQGRPVVADGRIAAGEQARWRRSLLRIRRQARRGRSPRPRHRYHPSSCIVRDTRAPTQGGHTGACCALHAQEKQRSLGKPRH